MIVKKIMGSLGVFMISVLWFGLSVATYGDPLDAAQIAAGNFEMPKDPQLAGIQKAISDFRAAFNTFKKYEESGKRDRKPFSRQLIAEYELVGEQKLYLLEYQADGTLLTFKEIFFKDPGRKIADPERGYTISFDKRGGVSSFKRRNRQEGIWISPLNGNLMGYLTMDATGGKYVAWTPEGKIKEERSMPVETTKSLNPSFSVPQQDLFARGATVQFVYEEPLDQAYGARLKALVEAFRAACKDIQVKTGAARHNLVLHYSGLARVSYESDDGLESTIIRFADQEGRVITDIQKFVKRDGYSDILQVEKGYTITFNKTDRQLESFRSPTEMLTFYPGLKLKAYNYGYSPMHWYSVKWDENGRITEQGERNYEPQKPQ